MEDKEIDIYTAKQYRMAARAFMLITAGFFAMAIFLATQGFPLFSVAAGLATIASAWFLYESKARAAQAAF